MVAEQKETLVLNKRRLPLLAVALTLSSVLVAVSAGSVHAQSRGAKAGITIGVLIPEENQNAYSAAYAKDIQLTAKKLGVNVIVLNSNYTASVQQAQMKELIAKKVDGIVLWPGVAGTTLPMLLGAKAANIPVNISNSVVAKNENKYFHSYTGPSDYRVGVSQAKLVARLLHKKGNIVEIEGVPGNEPTIERLAGLKDKLAKIAPKIKLLSVQPANWLQAKAESATAELLTRYGSKVNAVVTQDDVMAAGAAQAIESAGLKGKVKLIGSGFYTMTPPLLKSGVETATVFQSPCWDGVMAMRQIVRVVQGKTVPKQIIMPIPAVAKGNPKHYKPMGCIPGVTP